MWHRISGKSKHSTDDLPPQSSRRKGDESRSDECVRKESTPTSTSYSSTLPRQYPGAATASIASSYATVSGNNNKKPYIPPGLVRNASLVCDNDRYRGDRKRDKKNLSRGPDGSDDNGEMIIKSEKNGKDGFEDRGSRSSGTRISERIDTSRGPADFPDQATSASYSQSPGQYNGAILSFNGDSVDRMSSHIQDHFPSKSSAPYLPPLAASQGGPGLAAEYYGDNGQSVADQPGNRTNTPSLIIGAEPHLQPASSAAHPPPEPSSSGGVGAAASFFSGSFDANEVASNHGQGNSSAYTTRPTRPNSNYHSSSAPIIPTIGGYTLGTAAGYTIGNQSVSHHQWSDHEPSIAGAHIENSESTQAPSPSGPPISYYPNEVRPLKPGKQSAQSFTYAAGAAGLATAAYEHGGHATSQDSSTFQRPTTQNPATTMAYRHRHHGPLDAFVNFFKDPEGVAQFEEYSELIGVCRYCFAPGSSSRDAPRKHYHKGRHSNERHSSSARIDKDSRYYSSENEGRRKKNQSWLATGLAGYGLAKVGKSLFNQKNDFDDTSSASRGRYLPDGNSRIDRRRNRSKDGVKTGVTSGGKVFRKNPAEDFFEGRTATTYSTKHRSRSRSGSRDRKASLTKAALGKAIDSSIVTSSTRGRNRTPKGAFIKIRHRSQERSPERGLKTHGRKKDRGFLNFNNGSSSSSSENLPHTASRDKLRSSKRSKAKSKDDQKAEAALVGLGAAAAALALKASHQGHKKHRLKEPGGAKETRDRRDHSSGHAYRNKKSAASPDEEIWESAPEDDTESIDSGLAYGAPARRGSRASVSSESSGTNKWGWRWGSKKKQRERPPRRNPSDHSNFPDNAGVTGAGLASSVTMSAGRYQENDMDSTSSLHLQRVFAVPTSDPSRFDVKKEGSATSSSHQVVYSRPEAVPIQHPQPITPVSASICSAHAPYEHSYTAPTVLHVFSQASYHNEIATSGAGNNMREASIPIGQETNDMTRELKLHRKDTPPASFGTDSLVGSTIPSRRVLPRDDSSTVRFDLTEEQEGRERRERRRRKKEDKKCGEIEVERQIEEEHRTSGGKSNERPLVKSNPEENPERSSANSWSGPVAVGVIGASIGAAAVTERPRFEELREERRERRRREREREDEEEALIKSERRRRQRERDVYDAIEGEFHAYPGEVSDIPEDEGRQGRPQSKQRMSVWQAAANAKRSSGHEDYGSFFRPHEFLNRTDDQVKVTSANADADIEFDQSPAIITVEPKRVRDLSTSPTYSPTDTDDTDDKVDPSQRTFPWQVPRLRLIKPTPPSTRESTPIIHPRDADDEDKEEPRDGSSQSKVKWGDDESQEYTVIYRKEDREELNELPVDEADLSGHIDEPDLPDQETTQENSSKTSVTDNDLVSYGENIAFAATLAASAEDAGFDASIVIDDPAYRRRDSPPEPVELSMPGGFDDQDEPKLSKKNRKKMKRVISRRSRDGSANGRDHEADVQDINQVEESESQASTEAQNRDFDDEGKRVKEKYPEPEEDFFETSQFAAKGAVSEIQEKYESPTEEAGSNTSSAAIINDGETSRRFSMNARVDNAGSDIVVSAVSPASTIEAGNGSSSNPDEKRKGSLWDRVLSNSAESLAEENNGRDVTFEQTLADIEEQKLEGKKSKRTSTRDEVDEYGTTGRLSATRDAEREQSCSGGNTPEESGRISQDLPAKVHPLAPLVLPFNEMLMNPRFKSIVVVLQW